VTQISAGRKSKDAPTNKDGPTNKEAPNSKEGPTNKEAPTNKEGPTTKDGRTPRLEKVATNNVQPGSIALQTAILEK
jgi:hypothetical protein